MSTAAYLSYAGLVTKVRALYGKTMGADDFTRLKSMKSLDEVIEYLRGHPGWRSSMQTLSLGYTGRLELEKALAQELISEHKALGHFVRQDDSAFWAYPRHAADLRRIIAAYPRLRSVEELRSLTAGTIYAKTVQQIPAGSLPEFAAIECLLRSRYYTYLYQLVAKGYSGDASQRLKRLLGEAADHLNLLNLLRLKEYFPTQASLIIRYIPVHYRLNRRLFGQLNAAPTAGQAREILRGHSSLGKLAELPLTELDLALQQSMIGLLRQVIRSGEPSIAVAYAYLSYKELMLGALYSVIETAKYMEKGGGGT